jgi:hypothetical protein
MGGFGCTPSTTRILYNIVEEITRDYFAGTLPIQKFIVGFYRKVHLFVVRLRADLERQYIIF